MNYTKEFGDDHFMDYQEFCEIYLLDSPSNEDEVCHRCGNITMPMTYLDREFYTTPCWNCIGSKKISRIEATNSIIKNIKEYYNNKILGDRYYQLFVVDPIYFKTTIPHEYSVFKDIVNSLNPPSRNDIWFLDWEPGYPKIISKENTNGIKIINLSQYYNDIVYEKEKISFNGYEIIFPEVVECDIKHHSRYNILSKSSKRKNKRLKIGDSCIKLYNTRNEDVKSIFKITKNGEEIDVSTISYKDFVVIKLILLRNKSFIRMISNVVQEVLKVSKTFKDSVLLRNTITISPDKSKTFNLTWIADDKDHSDIDQVNISIL